jgi:hypothetical protein
MGALARGQVLERVLHRDAGTLSQRLVAHMRGTAAAHASAQTVRPVHATQFANCQIRLGRFALRRLYARESLNLLTPVIFGAVSKS